MQGKRKKHNKSAFEVTVCALPLPRLNYDSD